MHETTAFTASVSGRCGSHIGYFIPNPTPCTWPGKVVEDGISAWALSPSGRYDEASGLNTAHLRPCSHLGSSQIRGSAHVCLTHKYIFKGLFLFEAELQREGKREGKIYLLGYSPSGYNGWNGVNLKAGSSSGSLLPTWAIFFCSPRPWQRSGSDVEKLGHEPVSVWVARAESRDLACYTTALVP